MFESFLQRKYQPSKVVSKAKKEIVVCAVFVHEKSITKAQKNASPLIKIKTSSVSPFGATGFSIVFLHFHFEKVRKHSRTMLSEK